MTTTINALSATSRKRVTRKTIKQMLRLRHWHSEALSSANLAVMDSDPEEAAKWDAEAASLIAEYNELESSIV